MAIVIGTNGADDLDGTANNDLIISGNGADTIEAGDGNDLIFSGRGDDTVDAGDGNDVVFAGNGDDIVDGGDGHDLIFGGRGDDTINGGAGNDLIYGGSGDDIIDGGEGCDIVSAGSGNDIVIFDVDENSGAQNYFSGGSGNDTLRLRLTQAQVNEMTAAGVFAAFNAHVGSSGGFDFSTFGLSFAFNLKVWRFEQIEIELTSSPGLFTENDDSIDFNTVIAGTYEDGTQYDGLGGDDTVILANDAAAAAAAGYVVGTAFNAGAGNDTVTGGALDDIINGDAGNDVLNGGTGVDVLNGGDDDDRLILEDINVGDSVDGGDGDDTFVFGAANGSSHTISVAASQVTADGTTISVTNVENYEISGADMADSLSSTAGKTSFFGLGGNDNIFLTGNNLGDSVDGGDDFDIVFYSDTDAFGASLNINNVITVSTTDITVDGTVIALTDVERVVIAGRDGDDMITGSSNNDSLGGNDGNDTINGEGGSDQISGGTGVDNLFGGAGNDGLSLTDINVGDTVDGGADIDTFLYSATNGSNHNISLLPTQVIVDGTTISVINVERYAINGGDQNDNILGGAGDNTINGGAGDDVISFSTGNNTVDGGTGDDFVVVRDGTSAVTANLDTGDVVVAGGGISTISNFNSITTGDGDDNVTGNNVSNRLYVYAGDNTVFGGGGNDDIIVGAGSNTIDGGDDADALRFSSNVVTDVVVDLDAGTMSVAGGGSGTVTNVENVVTNGGNDTLTGDANNNTLLSGAGNDQISISGGNNSVNGGLGIDLLIIRDGAADVTVDLSTSSASIAGGGSSNVTGIENVLSGSGNDSLTGDDLSNLLRAGSGNNTVIGGLGNDVIEVTNGINTIDGGLGTDLLIISNGTDAVTINLSTFSASVAGGGSSTVNGIENLLTRDGDDVLDGDAGNNFIRSGDGDDEVRGGDGNDELWGEDGDDDLFGGAGNDTLIGGSGFNRLFAATGVDTIQGGDDVDQAFIEDLNGDTGDGGDGFDSLIFNFATGVNMDLATGAASLVGGGGSGTFTNFESVVSQGGNATASGTDNRDAFTYNGGGNTINALGGNDEIRVDGAGDIIDGGTGTDNLVFQTSDDVIANLSSGVTDILGTMGSIASIESLTTGSGDDDLIGTLANDTLNSGAGNDFINGQEGLDTIQAGDGSDFVTVADLAGDNVDGGADFDTIQFVTAQSVNFDLATGIATLVGGGDAGSYVNFEGVSMFGPGGAMVSGTNGANNLFVRGTGNTISLLDGADNIDTDMGGNTIDGGLGNDSARFNTSEDVTVDLAAGTTSILGVGGFISNVELIRTGAGDDILTGSANNDRFEVGTGADTVSTGLGDDNIFVFDGGDTIDGGGGDNDGLNVVTSDAVIADLSLGTLQIGADPASSVTGIENVTVFGSTDATLIGSDGSRDRLTGGDGNDTITTGLVNVGERDAVSGGDGNDTLVFNGSGVQANGGLGMDTFQFVDYDPGVGTQNALLFDVNIAEMDTINLTSWALGLTAAQIAAAATQGPTVNDSNLSLDGGDLTMTIFGINNADLVTFADDIFIV